MSAIVKIENLNRVFDVSKPWLNRVIERLPKSYLNAVNDVSFEIEEGQKVAVVGVSSRRTRSAGAVQPCPNSKVLSETGPKYSPLSLPQRER